jgi:hypothetical protein
MEQLQSHIRLTASVLIYGEIFAHFLIYLENLPHKLICNCSTLNFLIYEENLIFFFISVYVSPGQSMWVRNKTSCATRSWDPDDRWRPR